MDRGAEKKRAICILPIETLRENLCVRRVLFFRDSFSSDEGVGFVGCEAHFGVDVYC